VDHSRGYIWRRLTDKQRHELLKWRLDRKRPWHSPPHVRVPQTAIHLTAACYEHKPYIGTSLDRMCDFTECLLAHLKSIVREILAWCVLPNHYHVLVLTENNLELVRSVGRFHGLTSYKWNAEEGLRGRRVFFRCLDKPIRSERHLHATVNYIHHNPVRHQYVRRWLDWPWSSAHDYFESLGREELMRRWREYPVLNMGRTWDPPDL
jgi:putative transposase